MLLNVSKKKKNSSYGNGKVKLTVPIFLGVEMEAFQIFFDFFVSTPSITLMWGLLGRLWTVQGWMILKIAPPQPRLYYLYCMFTEFYKITSFLHEIISTV